MKTVVYIVIVALVGLFSFSAGENRAYIKSEETVEKLNVTKEELSVISTSDSFTDVVERVLPSVVGVEAVNRETKSVSLGSGVIVSDMGYLITNQHVVGNEPLRIDITLSDGSVRDGKLYWSDKSLDVAVVKFEGSVPAVAKMGEYKNVKVGEDVFAIGNPLSLQFERSVTKGIVSAVNRTITINTDDGTSYMEDLIQTDASINPGNSGGPLMQEDGSVIGINTMRVQSAEGMGFAVPVNICESVIEHLETKGEYETPYLGLYAYTSRTAKYLKKSKSVKDGLFVISLDVDGPAYESGIKYGDMITSINGVDVDTMLDLRRELFKCNVGEEVTLGVISGSVKKDIVVKAGEMTKEYDGANQ